MMCHRTRLPLKKGEKKEKERKRAKGRKRVPIDRPRFGWLGLLFPKAAPPSWVWPRVECGLDGSSRDDDDWVARTLACGYRG